MMEFIWKNLQLLKRFCMKKLKKRRALNLSHLNLSHWTKTLNLSHWAKTLNLSPLNLSQSKNLSQNLFRDITFLILIQSEWFIYQSKALEVRIIFPKRVDLIRSSFEKLQTFKDRKSRLSGLNSSYFFKYWSDLISSFGIKNQHIQGFQLI